MERILSKCLGMKSVIILICVMISSNFGSHDIPTSQTSSSRTTSKTDTTNLVSSSKLTLSTSSIIVSSSSTTTATTSSNQDRLTVPVGFNISISRNFSEELKNSYSVEYTYLASEVTKTLFDIFNGLHGFYGVVINSFVEGSVIADYDLQFNGESKFTMLLADFAQRLERLEQATIAGSKVKIDANIMNSNFKKAASLQETGDICDIAKCNDGYVCRTVNRQSFCTHACSFFYEICRDKGGCLYDPVLGEPACRCTDGAVFLENKCQYQQKDLSSSQDSAGTIAGAVVGSILGLIVTCICIAIFCWCRSNDGTGQTLQGTIRDICNDMSCYCQDNTCINCGGKDNKSV